MRSLCILFYMFYLYICAHTYYFNEYVLMFIVYFFCCLWCSIQYEMYLFLHVIMCTFHLYDLCSIIILAPNFVLLPINSVTFLYYNNYCFNIFFVFLSSSLQVISNHTRSWYFHVNHCCTLTYAKQSSVVNVHYVSCTWIFTP